MACVTSLLRPLLRCSCRRQSEAIHNAIRRIAGLIQIDLTIVPQDTHLANNQSEGFRCGDNGIFKGVPLTDEQKTLAAIARDIYAAHSV